MKLSKRIFACVLAASTVFSLVGCGSDDKKSTATTTTTVKATLNEAEAELIKEKADTIEGLPDIELENKEVTWLAHYAMNPNDDQAADASLELFKIKYGGKVIDNVTTFESRYDDLAKLVMSGKAPDVFPASDMDAFPKGAIRGMFQPIDDYIDYDDALWSEVSDAADSFAINDNHYVAVVDVVPSYVCIYNKTTIEENGLEDPAELFANGEWTLDKFVEMCEAFVNPEEDKYALDGYWYYDAIQQTTGVPMISLDDDGTIINNMTNAKIEEVESLMYELSKSDVVFPRKDNNWDTRGSGETGDGMGDGKTLFYPVGLWAIEMTPEAAKLFGDVEAGEVMFVPMPLNTSGGNDTHYISASVTGYLLCKNAPNPEGFQALMACKRACTIDEDMSELSDNQFRELYKWNDEMMEMKDTIEEMALENPVFEFHQGVSADLATLFANTICSATMMQTEDGTKSWTTVVDEQKGTVDWYIADANEELANLS